MKLTVIQCWTVCLLMLGQAAFANEPFFDGCRTEWKIYLAPQADPTETFAAEELSDALERIGGAPPQGHSARAEVTVVSLGQLFGDRRPEAEIDWKRLDREYDIPRIVIRLDGADGAEVAAGQVAGTFPTLLPGANRVTLASQTQPAADFRVIVKTAKVYR